jgi:hypothetical protein
MVARIAPSPIVSSVAIGDARPHGLAVGAAFARQNQQQNNAFQSEPEQLAQNTPRNTPAPAAPPGEAFAAAVIAGQLPPRPISPEQLKQRLGSAWQPPASPLRLMDRSI